MTIPDPVYEVVAGMFDRFAADLDQAAKRVRVDAAQLRLRADMEAGTYGKNHLHSVKVVEDEEVPL